MMTSVTHIDQRQFSGRVVEIFPTQKAIVEFQLDNKTERAILWYSKLKVNGEPLPKYGTISDYLALDTSLKFLCHEFSNGKEYRCRWYITNAWKAGATDTDTDDGIINKGLCNCTGKIIELTHHYGILSYSLNGEEENVLFLASKLFVEGERVSAEADLLQLPGLEEGQSLEFDAVPCDPVDREHCRWFATTVWQGRKSDMCNVQNTESCQLSKLAQIKLITSDPRSLFFRGVGRVLKIMSAEYGLAFCRIKKNKWESLLFHRSHFVLFGRNLANSDLTKILKEGDKLTVVAAAAPKMLGVRWVASQVRIPIHSSVAHEVQIESK